MYEYIKGKITVLTPATVVVEAGGVGYLLNISLQSYSALDGKSDALVYVHHHVREDAHLFYGFVTQAERELFRLLITVSGIGANTARLILSSYGVEQLSGHIATGNVTALKSIKGIGLKTAERIILDLKGKVLSVASTDSNTSHTQAGSEAAHEAVSALMILGFAKAATEKVVQSICSNNPSLSAEDIIREALGKL